MKMKTLKLSNVASLFLASLTLFSCNSNDDGIDFAELEGSGITITDDVDCCSAEEALQVYKFLQTVTIIPELSTEIDGKYNLFAYTKSGSAHVGYNDIYFVATKKKTGNYIKNFAISNLTPIMNMSAMNKKHSTPVGATVQSFNDKYLAVKRGWISYIMASSDGNTWSLSFDIDVLGSQAHVDQVSIDVEPIAEGQAWVKSFKANDQTYFLSIVNPLDWHIGENTIEAYVSQKSADMTQPYALASDVFTLDFEPTMPDMGGHSSPNNVALTKQEDGSYAGTINLTMSGRWDITFSVLDQSDNVIAQDIVLSVTL